MNKMQLLEQLRHFFWSMRRWWTWVLLSVSVICGGAASLVVMENKDSLWFTIVLYLVLGASLFTLLWLSSFFFVNWINKTLNNYYNAGTPNAKQTENMHISFSRLLSPKQRLQAYTDLKELRDATDHCFMSGSSSYLRIQWLLPGLPAYDEPKELVLPWPEDNQIFIDFTYEKEKVFLRVSREYTETGEVANVELFPKGAASKEEALDSVRLLLDEPCLLAYESLDEQPDGTSVPHKEALCAVTWIGGNH